mgnify:CR=1 FL=1
MKISYKRLWVLLIQRDITKVTLKREVGISAGTMCKLNKGEEVALSVFFLGPAVCYTYVEMCLTDFHERRVT